LGHALVYKRLGARTQVILHGMGGVTLGAREKAFSPGEQVLVSLAGPFFGIALGLATLGLKYAHGDFESELVNFTLTQLTFINLFWSAFNLLPVVPLDGGHVLESILCALSPNQGRVWARYVAIVLCGVFGLLAFEKNQPFVAVLFTLFGFQ